MSDETKLPELAVEIIMEIKLPVPVSELAAIARALGQRRGHDKIFMRQAGPMLQFIKEKKP